MMNVLSHMIATSKIEQYHQKFRQNSSLNFFRNNFNDLFQSLFYLGSDTLLFSSNTKFLHLNHLLGARPRGQGPGADGDHRIGKVSSGITSYSFGITYYYLDSCADAYALGPSNTDEKTSSSFWRRTNLRSIEFINFFCSLSKRFFQNFEIRNHFW